MKFFTRNKTPTPITPKQVRDVSDDDNPVTFATPIENEEREQELEEFEDNIKNNYAQTTEPIFEESLFENEILDEVNGIALDKDLTASDKTIKIYNIYNEYEKTMSIGSKAKIINILSVLDNQIKDEKTHDKYGDRINKLRERATKHQKGNADSTNVTQSKESKKNDEAVDWSQVASLLLIEAENQ